MADFALVEFYLVGGRIRFKLFVMQWSYGIDARGAPRRKEPNRQGAQRKQKRDADKRERIERSYVKAQRGQRARWE